MKSKLFLGIGLVLVLAIFSYNFIYQDHRNIETELAEFTLDSKEIADQFLKDPVASEKKYLNKTIEIEGDLTQIRDRDLTLGEHVFCQFNEPIADDLKSQSRIKIKGRCIGYDDLLEQIKIDQAYIIY
ncbi:MAG: hypothetical protein HKN54_11045 [Flavobacteriaceae bacterium]|nr:hypothetical protein [Flavobacteriaceae bacterium]